eukprot:TRINITY_DN8506_c0_g1_i1.p1 TRINITY_DN8506_c0_g1~~TRINITY_DN8506_c0_g1_i1.p1  ORF type:complete len:326 (+),score=30.80 TRINITY_DN8506_c0_g1_i1:144-1121(+)
MARILIFLALYFMACLCQGSSRFEKAVAQAQSNPNGVIDTDGENFALHALGVHNYSIILLFSTTEAKANCEMCGTVGEGFYPVAAKYKSLIGGYGSAEFLKNPTFFFYCELSRCRAIATAMKWKEIPKIVYIPPSEVKRTDYNMIEHSELYYEPNEQGISNWIGTKIKMPKLSIQQANYGTILTYVSGIVLLYLAVTRVLPNFNEVTNKPFFWFVMSLAAYAFAMAGTVYNAINKAPWSYKHPQNGQVMMIYPQSRQQFVVEGFIMAGMLTLAASLFVAFGAYIPTFKGSWPKRGIFLVVLLSFYMVYDGIFRIFKIKYPYYPLY